MDQTDTHPERIRCPQMDDHDQHWWWRVPAGSFAAPVGSTPPPGCEGTIPWECLGSGSAPAVRLDPPPAEDWLAPIRARANAATPGPWTYVDQGFSEPVGGRFITAPYHDLDISTEDAAFIAGTREDVPRLLDEVDRLRATIQRVRDLADKYDAVFAVDGISEPRGLVSTRPLRAALDGQVAP